MEADFDTPSDVAVTVASPGELPDTVVVDPLDGEMLMLPPFLDHVTLRFSAVPEAARGVAVKVRVVPRSMVADEGAIETVLTTGTVTVMEFEMPSDMAVRPVWPVDTPRTATE